jgi:hypothetical protein
MEIEKTLRTQLQIPSTQITKESEREEPESKAENTLRAQLQILSTQITQVSEREEVPSQSTISV